MTRAHDDDEVHTRLPEKGRNKQKIRNKFRDLSLDPEIVEEDEDWEELRIPQKINRRKR